MTGHRPSSDLERSVDEAVRRLAAGRGDEGEVRQGQIEMARAVATAVRDGRHLVVQAGTGTGKTWAYLVGALLGLQARPRAAPAGSGDGDGAHDDWADDQWADDQWADDHWAGDDGGGGLREGGGDDAEGHDIEAPPWDEDGGGARRVVVATATKALQDQLADKDLPYLCQHLAVPFRYAVVKGRSNYLCLQRAAEVVTGGDQLDLGAGDGSADGGGDVRSGPLGRQVLRLVDWAKSTGTGDRAELDFEPAPRAWGAVSVGATECPGAARCPRGGECFAERARRRADEADVVVVNTHLYAAHLASGGHVLPPHDVVVFDEAHELEDVAAASLGLELSAGRFRALARTMRPVVGAANADAVDNLVDAGARLEDALEPWRGRRLPSGLYDELTAALASASERVARALAAVRKSEDDPARKARCLQAGGHLGADLVVVADLPDTHVAWVEGPPASPVLKVALVDVAELLATVLWDDVTAVLTSATVPPRLASRVGLAGADCKTLDVGSPFAFREQALLYCPPLPDPRAPGYEAALHTELLELMRAAGGRTLALFTSRRAMQAAAEALAPLVPWEVMTQDQLPKPALVAAFSADPSSCLFATMGFWQGVDVPGEALSVVAIDRIPFPRPDEPLMQARRERAGPAAFRLVDLPRAATLLAQGAGRLIRSRQDRGVVAVLDSRLAVAGYKPELLAGLPPMRRTRDRPAVQAFLAPLRAGQP